MNDHKTEEIWTHTSKSVPVHIQSSGSKDQSCKGEAVDYPPETVGFFISMQGLSQPWWVLFMHLCWWFYLKKTYISTAGIQTHIPQPLCYHRPQLSVRNELTPVDSRSLNITRLAGQNWHWHPTSLCGDLAASKSPKLQLHSRLFWLPWYDYTCVLSW